MAIKNAYYFCHYYVNWIHQIDVLTFLLLGPSLKLSIIHSYFIARSQNLPIYRQRPLYYILCNDIFFLTKFVCTFNCSGRIRCQLSTTPVSHNIVGSLHLKGSPSPSVTSSDSSEAAQTRPQRLSHSPAWWDGTPRNLLPSPTFEQLLGLSSSWVLGATSHKFGVFQPCGEFSPSPRSHKDPLHKHTVHVSVGLAKPSMFCSTQTRPCSTGSDSV